MMQAHESQQSATIVSTIAILVGNKLDNNIDAEYREAIGDIIMWDIPVIKKIKTTGRQEKSIHPRNCLKTRKI